MFLIDVLRVLWIVCIYQICVLQIYSPSLYLSFNSINKVLGTAEVFNLKKFNLPAIPFIHHDFSVASKTSSPKPRFSMFSPMLFSRKFTIVYVLHLYLWFIHFKLIFVKGNKVCVSRFVIFACEYPISTPFIEKTVVFSSLNYLGFFIRH